MGRKRRPSESLGCGATPSKAAPPSIPETPPRGPPRLTGRRPGAAPLLGGVVSGLPCSLHLPGRLFSPVYLLSMVQL